MLPQLSRAPKLAFGPFEFDPSVRGIAEARIQSQTPLTTRPGSGRAGGAARANWWLVKIFATAFGPEPLPVTSNMASTRPSISSGRRSAMRPVSRAI